MEQPSAVAEAELHRRQALVLLATTASLWQHGFSAAAQPIQTGRTLTSEEREAVSQALQKAASKAKVRLIAVA